MNPFDSQPCINGHGLTNLDHITYTVYPGKMKYWSGFFQKLFNFRSMNFKQIDGFLIRNMISSCGRILVTLRESALGKSHSPTQLYLYVHKGEGISNLAFATPALVPTISALLKSSVSFEALAPDYYQSVVEQFPTSGYNLFSLSKYNIMVDGDMSGQTDSYVKHIFMHHVKGPITFELIERPANSPKILGNFSAIYWEELR